MKVLSQEKCRTSNYHSSEHESNQHVESDQMKFPCTLKNTLLIIRDRFGLSFASKGLGYLAALSLLLSLLARYKLSCYQTTPLLTISALADITLLKTTCHFLLLLVGFDTLTYRKELQQIPYTCGSSAIQPQPHTSDLHHFFKSARSNDRIHRAWTIKQLHPAVVQI